MNKLLTALFLTLPSILLAQTTWTGAISSNWHTPANWNTNNTPTAADNVVIPPTANAPGILEPAAANAVWVETGASLTVDFSGSLTLDGVINASASLYVEGSVDNYGIITIGDEVPVGAPNGVYNTGVFYNSFAGYLSIDRTTANGFHNAGGNLINEGFLLVGNQVAAPNASMYVNGGMVSNSGELLVPRAAANGILLAASGAFPNSGRITVGEDAPPVFLIGQSGSGTFTHNSGGILFGSGKITSAAFLSGGGILAPGYSAGTMTFEGDYDFSNTTIQIELGGPTCASNDLIAVNGAATLNSSTTVDLYQTNGCAPSSGTPYKFMTATTGFSGFPNVNWPPVGSGTLSVCSACSPKEMRVTFSAFPVELKSFTAAPAGRSVHLNWETASEKNTMRFVVERSADGLVFEPWESVEAAYPETGGAYAVEDKKPYPGASFYRLNMIDLDGSAVFSRVVKTALPSDDVHLYPNPVTQGILNIVIPDPAQTLDGVRILDLTGTVCKALPYEHSGTAVARLELSGIAPGLYMVELHLGNRVATKRVVVE